MNHSCRLACLVVANLVGIGLARAADDWPQWRGPGRDGAATGAALPQTLPERIEELWSVPVGIGQSSPVVAGVRLLVLSRQEDQEVCRALDAASGKELWKVSWGAEYSPAPPAVRFGIGPKATITVAGDRAYAFGIREHIVCLDCASGKIVWQKAFDGDYERPWPEFGTAASILIDGRLCIARIGTLGKGATIALDKDSGEVIWRNDDDGPAYDSPIAVTLAGTRQIVTFTQTTLRGIRAEAGNTLWSMPFETPFRQNIPTVVMHGDRLIVSGLQWGVAALEVAPGESKDGEWKVSEEWRSKVHSMYMDSPVVAGDLAFFLSNKRRGQFVCLDLNSGDVKWESEGRQADYASMALVGDRLLVLTNDGHLRVIAADGKAFRELANWTISESPTWCQVAVANGRVYLKSETDVKCLRL